MAGARIHPVPRIGSPRKLLLGKEGMLSKGFVVVNRSKQADDVRLRQEGLIAHLVGAGYGRAEPQIG